jgi:Carboxypeptidase regulatory-like domain/TonB-dependent Receptor Plug Domain
VRYPKVAPIVFAAMAAVLAVFAAAVPALAQTLRGSVVGPDSTSPVAGAIVQAADDHGATVARALTTARGEFTLRLPAEGRYAVTVLRIGFRPTRVRAITVAAGATETRRIVVAGQAMTLATVNVRDKQTCRVSADTGLAVARVWEEARKAMLSSQLSAEGPPLVAEWIEYDRTLDSAARYVRQQRIRSSRSPTTHAFRSAPVALLDSAGYVLTDSTGTTYYLPDADVLLSPMFSSSHCFHLEPARRGAGDLIGVAFSPTRERRGVREVEGTAWVDRQSAELRKLELHYTNLPAVVDAVHPGGTVEFLRLGDGNWLINRWNVRMPQLGVTTRPMRALGVLSTGTVAAVRGTQVTGGEVTTVSRRDSVMYDWRGPHVRLVIQADDSSFGAGGATLSLDGTDYSARADPDGRIDLSPVLAGRYRAQIHTPLMDSLGMPPVARDVEARDDVRVDTLRLPAAHDVLALVCPRDSVAHGEGMLRGRVLDSQRHALRQAAVVVTWQTNFSIIGGASGDQVNRTEKTIGAFSDDSGNWRVCGVPRQVPLIVSVATDAGSASRKTQLAGDFGAVDLEIGTTSPDAPLVGAGSVGKQSALVEIAVFDLAGTPVPDVRVDLEPPSGPARTVVTGATGRALIPEIAPGQLKLRARKIGFKEGLVAVTVDPGRNTVPILLGESTAPLLDTMRVIGGRRTVARLDEFETRRLNHMATVSYNRDDIVKRNPVDIWQMLRAVPSLLVIDTGGVSVQSTRSLRTLPDGSTKPCYLAVMVDGLIMSPAGNSEAFDLRLLPRPDEIHGVEIFAGPASIPVQYSGVGSGKWCGMIAVWTR